MNAGESAAALDAGAGPDEPQDTGIAAEQQAGADPPGPAFGCVDWYLYPQSLCEAVTS